MQARSATNKKGIDVSHWDGSIDWPGVAAEGDISFAIIKATDGPGVIDPMLRRNAGGSNAVGIKNTYYHFAHCSNNVQDEIDNFCNAVKGLPVDLYYALDVEGQDNENLGSSVVTQWCLTWLTGVEKRTGRKCMIYTGAYFARDILGVELAKWPLWIADYERPNQPLDNDKWSNWSIFQYTEKGKVNGIDADVDINAMEADFLAEMTGDNKITPFADVPAGFWAEGKIAVVTKAGLMNGYPDGTFKPNQPLTRAEAASFLNEILYKLNLLKQGK